MKKILSFLFISFLLLSLATAAFATPWEVLSDISYIKKGGVNAVRISFALPVHYDSHSPEGRSDVITINVHFNPGEVPDVSRLPLLQTLLPPESDIIPLEEVTYLTENGYPKLTVRFKQTVDFSVSQVMGVTSLVIFLPDERKARQEADPIVDPVIQDFIPLSEGTADESLARKMLEDGRKALKDSDNTRAIQIFTKLLSMPEHKYKQISLELLGVARERNNQAAQAKAVYENYLTKFPKGAESIRVKQRMADLIAAQMKPKKRLKQSQLSQREVKGYESQFDGYFSQYAYYNDITLVDGDTQPYSISLSNSLSLDWRIRSGDYDVRSRFDISYDYDFREEHNRTDGAEVDKIYTQLKNPLKGIYATVGRHSANTAGGFGRIDGASVGYNFNSKVRGDIVGGYIVDTSDKSHVQTTNPVLGVGAELNKVWRSLNLGPYFKMENEDGILDSAVIGSDATYFEQNYNITGILEYDVSFNSLNIADVRGRYTFNKQFSMTANLSYRNQNLIQMSNALTCHPDFIGTLGEYVDNRADGSIDKARQDAEDCTGNRSSGEISARYAFNPNHALNFTLSLGSFNRKFRLLDPDEITAPNVEPEYIVGDDKETQLNQSIQYITRNTFVDKDTFLVDLQRSDSKRDDPGKSQSESYDYTTLSVQYRRFIEKVWRIGVRFRVRRKNEERVDDTRNAQNEITSTEISHRSITTISPNFNMQYQSSKSISYYFEFSMDRNRYSGGNEEGYLSRLLYFGYDWNF